MESSGFHHWYQSSSFLDWPNTQIPAPATRIPSIIPAKSPATGDSTERRFDNLAFQLAAIREIGEIRCDFRQQLSNVQRTLSTVAEKLSVLDLRLGKWRGRNPVTRAVDLDAPMTEAVEAERAPVEKITQLKSSSKLSLSITTIERRSPGPSSILDKTDLLESGEDETSKSKATVQTPSSVLEDSKSEEAVFGGMALTLGRRDEERLGRDRPSPWPPPVIGEVSERFAEKSAADRDKQTKLLRQKVPSGAWRRRRGWVRSWTAWSGDGSCVRIISGRIGAGDGESESSGSLIVTAAVVLE